MSKPAERTWGWLNRRTFLHLFLSVFAAILAACAPVRVRPAPSPPSGGQAAPPLPPTPACGDSVTVSQTAGPYYTPGSPNRSSLVEPGMKGTLLTLTGTVLTRGCKPVTKALLDFWQADDGGAYDNTGFRLRGHLFTDEAGRYSLETILPGHYPGRTRHIHVNVQAPGGPVLTTQLYFPGEPGNQTDRIFRPELVVDMKEAADRKVATFDFVVDLP